MRLRGAVVLSAVSVAIGSFVPPGCPAIIWPTGATISVPVDNAKVCPDTDVQIAGTSGTDLDEGYQEPDNCLLHWWGDGLFIDGYYGYPEWLGETGKWQAPASPGTYHVFAAGDDTGWPDHSEYDWPERENYKLTRTIVVLTPFVRIYDFTGNIVPGDA